MVARTCQPAARTRCCAWGSRDRGSKPDLSSARNSYSRPSGRAYPAPLEAIATRMLTAAALEFRAPFGPVSY